jgi:hypothetical protein
MDKAHAQAETRGGDRQAARPSGVQVRIIDRMFVQRASPLSSRFSGQPERANLTKSL